MIPSYVINCHVAAPLVAWRRGVAGAGVGIAQTSLQSNVEAPGNAIHPGLPQTFFLHKIYIYCHPLRHF